MGNMERNGFMVGFYSPRPGSALHEIVLNQLIGLLPMFLVPNCHVRMRSIGVRFISSCLD